METRASPVISDSISRHVYEAAPECLPVRLAAGQGTNPAPDYSALAGLPLRFAAGFFPATAFFFRAGVGSGGAWSFR